MKKNAVILVADQDRRQADHIAKWFGSGIKVLWTESACEVLRKMEEESMDLVICDQDLDAGTHILEILEAARIRTTPLPVLIVSGQPSIEICKQAIRKGAFDYLVKPIEDHQLKSVIEQALGLETSGPDGRDFTFAGVTSRSPAMQSVFKILRRVAPTDLSVLIEGESGTGKELTARAIHDNSRRRDRAFYPLNCAGLTESLLESELFGHVKGAFTGAMADRKGLFQLSDNGTLFLDEIGDMPLPMQAKLLRVLEDGVVRPVGAGHSIVVDVRVISATNHDLTQLVEEKKFRQDLYFRVKEAGVHLPPLRQRPHDIPELFGYFLKQAANETGKDIHLITEPAMRALMAYSWPGNIRQLRNVVRTMVVMCEKETLDLSDLPPDISRLKQLGAPETHTLAAPYTFEESFEGKSLEEVEREHIRRTLQLTDNNRAEAARILKIGERTLYRKIKEYNL